MQTRDGINADEDKVWICALSQFFSRHWVFPKASCAQHTLRSGVVCAMRTRWISHSPRGELSHNGKIIFSRGNKTAFA